MSNMSSQTLFVGSRIAGAAGRPKAIAVHGVRASLTALIIAVDGWLGRIVDALLEWQRRQRDRAALSALDDRMLSDIGLSRADVEAEISKRFWQE